MVNWRPFSKKIVEAREQHAVGGAVSVPSGAPVQLGEARIQGWQVRAWSLWRCLGELHYPTSHLARQVGRLNWTVTVDGRIVTDEQAEDLLATATAGLELREASRLLGLNYQVAGEAWYVENVDGSFMVIAVNTPKLAKIIKEAKRAGRIALRLYNPDPVDHEQADSSVRTVLGPAEELLTYEALARAQSRSRISQAGMLLVPSEATFDEADPFGADLERAMMTPIADESHPSAMVPVKVEMEADLIEKAKHLTLERSYDNRIHEKQERAIKRIALALDIPPELLLGVDTATHWTAWLVALETYTSHLEPLAAPIGELYAEVLERLFARQDQDVEVTVTPDPGEILAKRSTVRDALDAAKLGAVGLAYVREAIGADEEDAPTEAELAILRLVPREPGREPMVDEETGPPAESTAVAAALVPGPDFRSGELAGVLAMTVDQVRTKIGSKLRTQVRGSELAGTIDRIHNRDVVATLGLDAVAGHIELNVAVVDALTPFAEWWASNPPSDMPAATAALLVGIWVADTLASPADQLAGIPERLMCDLLVGIGKEMSNAS